MTRKLAAGASGLVFAFILAVSPSSAGEIPENIYIVRGRQVALPAEGVVRVAIGDDAVIRHSITRDNRQIILFGRNPGETDFTAWYRDGREQTAIVKVIPRCPLEAAERIKRRLEMSGVSGVSVVPEKDRVWVGGTVYTEPHFDLVERVARAEADIAENLVLLVLEDDTEAVMETVKKLLGGIAGIAIDRSRDRVVITGRILRLADREIIDRVAADHAQVFNYAELDLRYILDEAARGVAARMEMPWVTVEPSGNDTLVLKGVVLNEEEKEKAGRVARAYARELVRDIENLVEVKEAQLEINACFVISSRSIEDRMGVNLLAPDTLDVDFTRTLKPVAASELTFYAAKKLSEIFPEIGDSEADNVFRWQVTTMAGQTAGYHQGGEIVIEVIGQDRAGVEYKKYGVLMEVTPVITSTGDVRLALEIEISAPKSRGAGGRLEFSTYRTVTEVVIPYGQSLIIAGTKEQVREDFRRGAVLLRDIPLLNLLFSTRGRREIYQDMFIVITPASSTYLELRDRPLSEEHRRMLEAPAAGQPDRG